ncbi:MAG: sulfite exporter TauE/SafE family protein, partial [Rhodobacter sp.]|nr:sulfite exporter TauE/SafE family protein [Rhodobacter sp.]
FSGFGTAMIYLPIAAHWLPPVWVLVTLVVVDLFGPIPAVPRALRDGHPRDVLRLGAGALIGMPVGVLLLTWMAPDAFRYAVSLLTMALLVLLVGGVRYRGRVSNPAIYATGGLSGFLGGSVGLAGPPVILLYMARPLSPAVIRANVLLFLLLTDVLLFVVFAQRGLLEWTPLMLGVLLAPLYLGAVWLGSAIFDPARGSVYRWVAYVIIAASALGGLPIWT